MLCHKLREVNDELLYILKLLCSFFFSNQQVLVTLAVDVEMVAFGGRALAATVDEAHHHSVVLLILQVVELGGEHIEQGVNLLKFLTVTWRPEELH